jgi:hypothetical protein
MAKPSGMRRVFNTENRMRPSLHIRSERLRHRANPGPTRRTSGPARDHSERPRTMDVPELAAQLDLDAQRVREAGGPIDHALYACACGYVFDAAVSTTVACPHCGDNQAW